MTHRPRFHCFPASPWGLVLVLATGTGAALRALPGDPAAVLGVASDGQPVRVADFRGRPPNPPPSSQVPP
jgi:hypothetical protein